MICRDICRVSSIESDPGLGGLCDGPLATDGSRACGLQHQVPDSHADGSLSLLDKRYFRIAAPGSAATAANPHHLG